MGRDRDLREEQPVEPREAEAQGNDPDAVRKSESGDRRSGTRSDKTSMTPSGKAGAGGLGRKTDPDQDAGEWRARGPLTDTYAGGGHGARLGGGEGEDDSRRTRRKTEYGADRGTSWPSVIYGWLASLGAALILSVIVGAVVGALLGAQGISGGAQEGGISGLVGLIVTLFLAFLIGGYVAGRMAARSGFKHGIFVPLLAVILTLLLALVGGALGLGFAEQLSSATLPGPLQDAVQQAQQAVQGVQQPQNLGTIATVSGILALLAPFIGGALGGLWGAARGRNRP